MDESYESRSIAWGSGNLYVMVNAWWEPLTFTVHHTGDWQVELSSAAATLAGGTCTVAARSVVVLRRLR